MSVRHGARAGVALGLAAVVVALSACSLLGNSDTPASGPSASPDPSVSATPSSAPPTLQPNGTAADNRAYFDYVNTRLIASNGDAKGADFVQALSAAGFDHSAITVTPDKTTTGLAADSIQFAVKFKNKCLIGQYGPKSNGFHSIVGPPISTGTCLIGQKEAGRHFPGCTGRHFPARAGPFGRKGVRRSTIRFPGCARTAWGLTRLILPAVRALGRGRARQHNRRRARQRNQRLARQHK